jgi:hypothetical protein
MIARKTNLFVPMYLDTINSPAWRELSHGAQVLFFSLKKRYHRKTQGPVFISRRDAAKETRSHKDAISRRLLELTHFGFIVPTQQPTIGIEGKCGQYRITDERFLGNPPTKEFCYWNGTPFELSLKRGTVRTPKHCPSNEGHTVPQTRDTLSLK